MAPYCDPTQDLLVGSIPMPAYVDPAKYVQDAADEMDSYLGSRYVTPVVLVASLPAQRPSALLLKRINAHLASGRIILAAAAGGEDTEVHAYGWSLVRQAVEALKNLQEGKPLLVGATPAEATAANELGAAPIISNGDPYSQVDAFYEVVTPGQTSINPLGYPYGIPSHTGRWG